MLAYQAFLQSSQQILELNKGWLTKYTTDKVQSIFGVQVFTFIPPYDNFNDATIAAMKANQLTVISSADYIGDFPREQDGITYIPGTVTTANVVNQTSWAAVPLDSITQQIQASWDNYGIAIVVIHPQQFSGEAHKKLWDIYLQTLDWIPANGGTIIKLDPPAPTAQYTVDPLQLSIGILIGMISTLLIYTAVAKRSNGKHRQERERRSSSALTRDTNLVSA
jgi:hypothetical protein